MSRTKRYRNWLVWWLQQKRKERNATTGLPDYILAALTYFDGDTYDDGSVVKLASGVGTTEAPAGYDYKAQSFEFDGTAYLALTGILATDTVTNSGDSTLSTDTNKLEGTAGDAWDITITSSGGTDKYWISGCDAVGTSIPVLDLVNGGTVYAVLTTGTLPDFYASSQDGVTGFNQNLLGFSQWENLLTYSEDYSQVVWPKVRSTITPDAATAPDGTVTASLLAADSSSNQSHYIYGTASLVVGTMEDDTSYTFLVYAKKGEIDWIKLEVRNKANTSIYTFFDLTNGVSGLRGGGAVATVEDVGDGWYLCSFTFDSGSGATNPSTYISPAEGDNDVYFAGDVEGDGLYIWRSQIRQTALAGFVGTDGAPIQGIQPADPSNPSLDITGNTLQYPGPIKLSAELTGYTGTWDSSAYGELSTSVVGIETEGAIEVKFTHSDTKELAVMFDIGIGNPSRCNISYYGTTQNRIAAGIGAKGSGETWSGIDTLVDGETYIAKLHWNGTTATLYLDDEIVYQDTQSGAPVMGTGYIGCFGGSNFFVDDTAIIYCKVYNSSDTLIHHWVCENGVSSTGTTIYAVVGSNNATLNSASTPFFTTESSEVYLLENGWELSSGNYIPAKAAGGESAAGNALTASPGDLRTVEPGFFEMPQDKELIAADIVGQYGADLFTETLSASKFTPYDNNTVADDGDAVKITYVDNFSGARIQLKTANIGTNLTVGRTYEVNLLAKVGSGDAVDVRVHGATNEDTSVTSTEYTAITAEFICDNATTNYILTRLMGTGEEIWLKDITIQELQDPLNVFFEPDGDQRSISYDELLPTYGAELITNGDASDTTSTDSSVAALTGWTNGDTHDASNKFTIADGQFTLTSDGTLTSISQGTGIFAGDTVQISGDIISATGLGIVMQDSGGGTIYSGTEVGSFTINHTLLGTTLIIKRLGGATTTVFDNISIKEITATGANVNDQYFYGDEPPDELALYSEPQDADTVAKIEKYLKIT